MRKILRETRRGFPEPQKTETQNLRCHRHCEASGFIMAATWHSMGASIHIMIKFRAGNYANYSRAGWRWFTLLSALLCALDAEAGQAAVPLASDAEARVAALTNDLRSKQGLPPVEIEPRLTAAARAFAAYVARTDKLDHDADGSTPSARAEKS